VVDCTKTGRRAEARSHLDRLIAARPDEGTLHEDRAAVYGKLGVFAYPLEKVYSRALPDRGCRCGRRLTEVTLHARRGETVIGHERLDGCPVLMAVPQFEALRAG
jgi:hypothetical protein